MGDSYTSVHSPQRYDPHRGSRVNSATYYNESTSVRRASIANVIELGRLRRHVAVLDRDVVRSISLVDRDMRILSAALQRVRMSSGRSVIDPTGLPTQSATPRCILYGDKPPRSGRRRTPVARCRPHVVTSQPPLESPSSSLVVVSERSEGQLNDANRKLASGHFDVLTRVRRCCDSESD